MRATVKQLLFISHRVPYPPDKGERIRAFHEIRVLSAHFEVTLATLAHSDADIKAAQAMRQWCRDVLIARAGGPWGRTRAALTSLVGKSATEGYFRSPRLSRALSSLAVSRQFDLVVGYCSSTLPYVLAAPVATRVVDLVDVDSAKWLAYAGAASWPLSWLYRTEAKAVSALEQKALERCDAAVVVSEAEAQALGPQDGKVVAVGNGVDAEYFSPRQCRPSESPPSLVFTGTMDYRPNVDGVDWFAREVLPCLRNHLPGLVFQIVGRDPSPAVRSLGRHPGVVVTGSVPDVRPYLASATAAVCPLRIARGVQNKVLEAMAMGRAVIASPQALEGLDVRVGEEALLARSPGEWEEHVANLVGQPAGRERIEKAARKCAVDRYSWEARLAPLVSLCHRLLERRRTPQTPGQGRQRQSGQSGRLTSSSSAERPGT